MQALRAARALALPSWCIGAGAVCNLVWDHLHGYPSPSFLADIDLAYFDPDEPPGRERDHQAEMERICPGMPWEVTNQAHVHLWFERHFGHAVPPLRSLHDAVASWPEFATSVGIGLGADGTVQIIAPLGLDDLFAMRIRRNPARVSVETFRQRIAGKRYTDRWPRVEIVAG
ncbi:nucleotidyltransferase family protein [Luteimonas sp. BDR2-5]|nr:nucleotidyltransferase family protein [Luteimonas sp. BDR2-5]MCD9028654.1 nucleotidyltransferase family protein [Luteimonas sp. BDR2-5]